MKEQRIQDQQAKPENKSKSSRRMVITHTGTLMSRGYADTLYQKGLLAKPWRTGPNLVRIN